MKKETINLQEFANQVKELAKSVDQKHCGVDGEKHISKHMDSGCMFSCWINEHGTYFGKTPEMALARLKKAIDKEINKKWESKPLEGDDLRILNDTYKRLLSKKPTRLT